MTSSPNVAEETVGNPLRFTPGAGYWIAPNDAVFPVKTHILAICECPKLFGLDADGVREAFTRHGEPWASEGNARREIILTAVNGSGWIRVRHYRRSGWTINVPSLDLPIQKRIAGFFLRLFPDQIPFDTVRLDHPAGVLTSEMPHLLRRLNSHVLPTTASPVEATGNFST